MTYITDHHELASRLQYMGSLPEITCIDQGEFKHLLSHISHCRSQDMRYFLQVGRAIYLYFPNQEGLNLWKSCSVPEMHSTCDSYWTSGLTQTCSLWRIMTCIATLDEIDIDNEEVAYSLARKALLYYGYTKDELQYLSSVPIDVFKRVSLYGVPCKHQRYKPNMGFVYDLEWLHRIANLDSEGNAERSLATYRQVRNQSFPVGIKAINYRTCKKIPAWAVSI